MQNHFLQTHALDLYDDYPDWHKGRHYFGIWYIDVSALNVAYVCQMAQRELSPFLWAGYRRAFHITVFVNGFWVRQAVYDDDCMHDILAKQVRAVRELGLSPFYLRAFGVDSFMASPYVVVLPSQDLFAIRQALARVYTEITPSHYTPHITLGFYRDNYPYAIINQALADMAIDPCQFLVNALHFGIYRADDLQGALVALTKVDL